MFKLLGFAFRAAIIEVLAIGGLIWYVTSSADTENTAEPTASIIDLSEIGHDIGMIADRLTDTLMADESDSRDAHEAKPVPESASTVDPVTEPRRLFVGKPQAMPTELPVAAPLAKERAKEPVVDPQVVPGLLVVSTQRPTLRPIDEAVATASEPSTPVTPNPSFTVPPTNKTVPFPRSRTRGWR